MATEGCLDENTLAALMSGKLSAEARRRAEAHLDDCPSCRDEVADLARRSTHATEQLESQNPTQQSWVSTLPRGSSEPHLDTPLSWGDLVDHYRVEHLLGRGGMGEVYLARDTKLRRRVALKMVGTSHLASPRSVERFMREARTTARVNHPNIVTIHGVGEHHGRPYLALEYVEGVTLRQWINARKQRLLLRDSLLVGLAVADALVEAHRHGILHRDLKPENVLIGGDGRVRVVDFGLAETIESDDAPPSTRVELGPIVTGVAGTPRYMAPEQWLEQECSPATDVWALGVMLFELASCGAYPFPNDGVMNELAMAVCNGKPDPLPSKIGAPPAMGELILRCLARKPDDRPQAIVVATTLRTLLDARPKRRARRTALWIAAAAALAMGGAAAALTAERRLAVAHAFDVDVPEVHAPAPAASPVPASASATPEPRAAVPPPKVMGKLAPAPSAPAATDAAPAPTSSNLLKQW
ncbi:MAG TPA: protein kinase [Polyangiaceae bacterium]|nr:protein kinase [Polyangiaceae bacterium]